MVYALILSYRGRQYAGWQRQDNALAVQQVVEEALSRLLGDSVRIVGASRTDAGVHARGQVAHLDVPRELPLGALHHGTNSCLPEDIRVLAAGQMPVGFHARKGAVSKEYRYRLIQASTLSPLDAPFAIQAPLDLDLEALRQATSCLRGEHDFSAFALAGGGHRRSVRRIYAADWRFEAARLELRLVGDGFLRGMVRSIVGTLLEVGRGRRSPDEFRKLLSGRPRGDAGPTAPARGLVLQRVSYAAPWALPEVDFPLPRSGRGLC